MDETLIAERNWLLTEGNRLRATAEALDDAGDHTAALPLWRQREQLSRRYLEWLPEITVARCPHTDHIVRWPIDTVDIDGWFWNSDAPLQRLPPVPPRWLTMTGAMQLVEPVTYATFDCEPGPGAPFVVPRLLHEPGVVAVIAQFTVGAHTGWPITYFGPTPAHRKLENLWGTTRYVTTDDHGQYQSWHETTPWPADYDFNLAPWLAAEKLQWIAPGDESATLRQGPENCPYLDIDGPHGLAIVSHGSVRYWSPPEDS